MSHTQFNGDGTVLAVTVPDRETLYAFDVASGERLLTLSLPGLGIRQMEFESGSDVLRVGSREQWFSLAAPRLDVPYLVRAAGQFSNLRACPDGLDVVPVVPFPSDDELWAPAHLCGDS